MKQVARFACLAFLLVTSAVTYGTHYTVTLDNWKNHPDVKAVRVIYDEIKNGINNSKYKSRTRRFDVESAMCETYPVRSKTLVVDPANRVRLYKIVQIGAHQEPFTVERYYDSSGTLRLVFVERLSSNLSIYLNGAGNVFWALEQGNGKYTVFDSTNEDWETKPDNGRKAREDYQARQLCPEIPR